jgi:hypothetical protein
MKAQTTVKGGILLFLAAVTCLWLGEGLKAATGDTVADLQAAAKEGLPDALDAKQGIDDINRLLDELRTDATFAAHFYETMKSNNRAGLLRLIQPRARNTKVSILSLDNESSFTLKIGFQTKKANGSCYASRMRRVALKGKTVSSVHNRKATGGKHAIPNTEVAFCTLLDSGILRSRVGCFAKPACANA